MSNEELTMDDLLEGVEGDNPETPEEEVEEVITEEEPEEDAPAPAPANQGIDPKALELALRIVQAQNQKAEPEEDEDSYLYDPKALLARAKQDAQSEIQALRAEIDTIKRPAKIAEIAQNAGLPDASVLADFAKDFSTADLEFLAKSPAFVNLVKKAAGATKAPKPKTPLPANTPKGPKPASVQVSAGDQELLQRYAAKYGKDSKEYKERRDLLLKGDK